MLKRRKPPRSGIVRNPDRIRSEPHKKWVRGHECAVARSPRARTVRQCKGKIEAHHVRLDTQGGTSIKPGDQWTVPLCGEHHAELDSPNSGQRTFDVAYGVDLRAIAERLAAQSPALRRLAHERRILEEELGA